MKNKVEDLRNHLFATLERLSDDELDLDKEVKKAKSIVDVANSIIETGRIENEYFRIVQSTADGGDGFLGSNKTKQIGGGENKKPQ